MRARDHIRLHDNITVSEWPHSDVEYGQAPPLIFGCLATASLISSAQSVNEVQNINAMVITWVMALPNPDPVPPAREWYRNIPLTLSAASISRRKASRVGVPSSAAAAKP